ncbi:hypothetical protein [Arthrobacter koreensis]|uniref:hypothetical protein n=1 Tax=Arthrobacter koreensis TaxID=199136 RepID=UPI002DBF4ED7|nr:hypothetical protein [Arthrobacter koreensis]MEB7447278.1 hypothetical protein [Arthrobacter koreensis]
MKRFNRAGLAAGWVLGAEAAFFTLALIITGNSDELVAWVIACLALLGLVFLIALLLPEITIGLHRIRDYPHLESKIQSHKTAYASVIAERDSALALLKSVPNDIEAARTRAHREVIGSLLAYESKARLAPVGSVFDTDQGLRIVAELVEGGSVRKGARYVATTASVGTPKGVLSVVTIDGNGKKISLEVAEIRPGSDKFWDNIKEEAEAHEGPPKINIVADQLVAEILEGLEE